MLLAGLQKAWRVSFKVFFLIIVFIAVMVFSAITTAEEKKAPSQKTTIIRVEVRKFGEDLFDALRENDEKKMVELLKESGLFSSLQGLAKDFDFSNLRLASVYASEEMYLLVSYPIKSNHTKRYEELRLGIKEKDNKRTGWFLETGELDDGYRLKHFLKTHPNLRLVSPETSN